MKYRKKPVVVEAVKYDKSHIGKELDFCDEVKYNPYDNEYYVQTLEGAMKISEGDYIIRGAEGEFYPCREDIFLQTYEEVKANEVKGSPKFEEVKMYKITDENYITYGKVFESKRIAEEVVKNEKLFKKITRLFEEGKTFGEIEKATGYNFGIYEENSHMRDVNKDNCFVISHWQCFNKPAYKICSLTPRINSWGDLDIRLDVIGKGGWTGYHGQRLSVNSSDLRNPRPKEEFEEF